MSFSFEYYRAHNNAPSSGVSSSSQHINFCDMAIIEIIARALDCNNRKQKISVSSNPTTQKEILANITLLYNPLD